MTHLSPSPAASRPSAARSLRHGLREETREAHEALDTVMSQYRLDDASNYAAFLRIHEAVLPAIERALEAEGIAADLPDWPMRQRRDALAADLAELPGSPPCLMASPPDLPDLSSRAARFGATYVLEGSRMGAKLLVRSVPEGDRRFPTRFLRHGESEKLWPSFVAALDDADKNGISHDVAIHAARHIFAVYEQAARVSGVEGSAGTDV
ncbi:biliverdin-producing heme oxygenase [Notoacmeibacter sp. MSK16QG-6]|uniref:biliverdin-producing heme oxygenase n=1 Tax=Notoacmeibacter sp. MSK16QG-6 TaxID=2957982 RepID=UPI00209D9081|nr:biliverdin-producing heme oxygenase [Notoacmeibacter sp. MSK16QG-6]MCP1198815.1 biliverdin-producing heme oxygenase [Notoacmeibacter sp. MSK16QG-6]